MNRAHVMLVGGAVALLSAAAQAANMRDHLESRRITPVVYVGVVAEDQKVLTRERMNFRAEAKARVLGVVKGAPSGKPVTEARLRYNSWDDKTPPLTGGPQYRLRKGMFVLAFASSFDAEFPDGYLISGTKEEVRDWTRRQRDSMATMTAAQLEFHEINEAGRKAQLEVYDKALVLLEKN